MKKQIAIPTATFALILGCSAMPPAHVPVPPPPQPYLSANAPATGTGPITAINFYYADINDTDWKLLATVPAANGQVNVVSPKAPQTFDSTLVFTSQSTNEIEHTYSDYSNIATNTIGSSPLSVNVAPVISVRQ